MKELLIAIWRLMASLSSLGLSIAAIYYGFKHDYQQATFYLVAVTLMWVMSEREK